MNDSASIDPAKRQVLVNLGNRFVVFGSEAGLPEQLQFSPEDSPIFPRVADEREVAETRIAETLQVSGMTRGTPDAATADLADFILVEPSGHRILVDIKVRERDPKQRDIRWGNERLDLAKSKDQDLEVWFLNIERLKLTVMRREGGYLRIDGLVPLNVWAKDPEGVFERRRVVDEVDDWLSRIERLYADVREWLADGESFRFEQIRTVTMSEEMMQEFAVTDRELPILDVLRGDQVVTSFVPRGLWLIGAWGRIDIINKDRTSVLIAIKKSGNFEWRLSSPDDRRLTKSFDKSVLSELMSGQ